ncbi:MAG: hypothetical protein Q7R95_09735, partial [bacterium]|nr:hypothetical protein [bacterium]
LFFDSCISRLPVFNIRYGDYKHFFDGIDIDNDFIDGQYRQFLKIFGGNHFIEFGKSSHNGHYILIHCGSNGFYQHILQKNIDKKERCKDVCNDYAKANRLGIMRHFSRAMSVEFNGNHIDQAHTFHIGDCNIIGYSKSDLVNGNIFTCGPFSQSYIIQTNTGGTYVKHGCDELRYTKLIDFIRYGKEDYLNYGRSFAKFSGYDINKFIIVDKLTPILNSRQKMRF